MNPLVVIQKEEAQKVVGRMGVDHVDVFLKPQNNIKTILNTSVTFRNIQLLSVSGILINIILTIFGPWWRGWWGASSVPWWWWGSISFPWWWFSRAVWWTCWGTFALKAKYQVNLLYFANTM